MARDPSEELRNTSPSPSSSLRQKSKNVLKKGPWTKSEDTILVEYVKKHGEGNWNAVQRHSGLMRCGKSCRLRWANHLRPNLKKGAFSDDEEKLIVELHAKLGNKWARMASQLPGRTDNEIKNYWNTRLKRRQRAGLPIYPQEAVQQEHQQPLNSPSPLLNSSNSPNPNPDLPFYDPLSSPNSILPLQINPQLKLYQANNGGVGTSDPPLSLSQPYLNHCLSNAPLSMHSFLEYNNCNTMDYGILGLPSIQSPAETTTASSGELVAAAADGVENYEAELGFRPTGLLGDLFGESNALAGGRKPERQFIAAVGGHNLHQEDGVCSVNGSKNASEDCNKNQEIMKAPEEEGISCMEDDLLDQLLDNFPLSVPIPEWNEGEYCGESPVMVNSISNFIQSQSGSATHNPGTAATAESNNGSCLWNNMPSIY